MTGAEPAKAAAGAARVNRATASVPDSYLQDAGQSVMRAPRWLAFTDCYQRFTDGVNFGLTVNKRLKDFKNLRNTCLFFRHVRWRTVAH